MFKLAEQPQSIGDMLSASYELFISIVKTVIPFVLVAELLLVFSQYLARPVAGEPVHFSLMFTLLFVVAYLVKIFVNAFTLLVADDCNAQRELAAEAPLKKAVSLIVPLILASLLVGLSVAIGFALFVLPGLFLLIMLVFYIPAIVLDNKGVTDSIKYSWELVKGNWWRVFGIYVLFLLVVFAVSLILGIFLAFMPAAITYLIRWLLYGVLAAFYPCLLYVVYNDLKLRAKLAPAESQEQKATESSEKE